MSETIEQSAKRAWIEVATLREQVSKLTKERDALRSRRCEVCGYLEHEREHTGCLREQLAALAEQNARLREALTTCVCAMQDYQAGIGITDMFDRGERLGRNVLLTVEHPDLASPVLNRIRAEGMRMAADFVEPQRNDIPACGFEFAAAIRARADELEKTS